MTAQADLCAVDVLCNLSGEFLRRSKGVVAPQALDKFDGDRLAVEIVLMVEQIDLD